METYHESTNPSNGWREPEHETEHVFVGSDEGMPCEECGHVLAFDLHTEDVVDVSDRTIGEALEGHEVKIRWLEAITIVGFAECSCGWKGPARRWTRDAARDRSRHLQAVVEEIGKEARV